jgi:hypothetical protein
MTEDERDQEEFKRLSPRQQALENQRVANAEALLTSIAEALHARGQPGRGRQYRNAMLAFLGAFEEASEDVGDKRYERQQDRY